MAKKKEHKPINRFGVGERNFVRRWWEKKNDENPVPNPNGQELWYGNGHRTTQDDASPNYDYDD